MLKFNKMKLFPLHKTAFIPNSGVEEFFSDKTAYLIILKLFPLHKTAFIPIFRR
jgi:hypothetical protein